MAHFTKRTLLSTAMGLGLLAAATSAHAITVTSTTATLTGSDINKSFSVNWISIPNENATGAFTLTSFGSSSATLHLVLTNGSATPANQLVGISFNTSSRIISGSAPNSNPLSFAYNNSGTNYQACLFVGGGCSQPSSGGLTSNPSQSDVFNLTLNFQSTTPPMTSLRLSNFKAYFINQTTGREDSYNCDNIQITTVPGTIPPPTRTPEPEALSLLLLGAAGIFVAKRRRK